MERLGAITTRILAETEVVMRAGRKGAERTPRVVTASADCVSRATSEEKGPDPKEGFDGQVPLVNGSGKM